ncbi:MAG: glutamine synthetase family protein [Christensenellales bacterium]|jgi:glutamine synthetase|nr:glutamine synthetase family protein [Eubacteriales bacterium]
MTNTANEVLAFVKENDVKFIKLAFCDPFGFPKNISIMPDELPSAFENGIPFDASAIKGFSDVTRSDLLLFPDPSTLSVLPWRPGPGRVVRFYCDIKNPDKSDFAHDGRKILKQMIKRCEDIGYVCKIGAECEFYLFKTDENGEPTQNTLDYGGYLDVAPLDKGENIRREICLCLEEMGLKPESSHHEQGPGQNEIDFQYSDALSSADNLMTFKSVVKVIAARNGLYASFMPKPLLDKSGSGLHVNISLSQNGFNIFKNRDEGNSAVAESFIAGILQKTPEITLFLNPTANSYERFGKFEAPKYVSWSHQNRSQLVRIPAAIGERVRMEMRSPDPTVNPYLAFALIIGAGIYGIENSLKLPPAVDADLYNADASVIKGLTMLPVSLDAAITAAQSSEFVKTVIGDTMLSKYIAFKKEEAAAFGEAKIKDNFYRERYFKFV